MNAAPGLGEAMVSGLVTPDTLVVDKATRTVIEFTPGDQPGGPALSDAAVADLVDLSLRRRGGVRGRRRHRSRASPTDGWYLLQARPITTRGAP